MLALSIPIIVYAQSLDEVQVVSEFGKAVFAAALDLPQLKRKTPLACE